MKLYILILPIFFMALCGGKKAAGQQGNSCPVVASIWPPVGDSIVTAGTIISLTSTSTNASSLSWLQNGFFTGLTGPMWNISVTEGAYNISLVASNGSCSDTSTVIFFAPGQPYNIDTMMVANYGTYINNEEAVSVRATADGGMLMAGLQYLWQECGTAGILVKIREKGCIDWSKKIVASTYCNSSVITNLHASADSSYYVVTNEINLLKLDKNGDVVWYKRYNYQGSPWGINYITGDEYGDVYLLSGAFSNGWSVTKVNPDGQVIWNKVFRLSHEVPGTGSEYAPPTGLVYNNQKLYVAGMAYSTAGNFNFSFLTSLNATNGTRDWQYGYIDPEFPEASGFVDLSMYDTLLLISSGAQAHLVTLIDRAGNLKKSIKTQFPSSYAPKVTKARADANGRIYLMQWTEQILPLQPFYWYATNFAEIDTSLNKYWGMVAANYSRGFFKDATMVNNKFVAVGQDFGYVDDAVFGSRDMRVVAIDSLRANIPCYSPESFSVVEKTLNRIDFNYIVDTSLSLIPAEYIPHSTVDAYIQSRYTCPDFIDSCSFLKISGITNLCNFNNTYTYKIHRNKKCALLPQWKLPAGVIITAQTDSSISLKFPAFGEYRIASTLNSCIPVKDSLLVRIVSKSGVLNIGADTSICPGSTIKLRAANNFLSYKWSDNSTDSNLNVSLPGVYWIETIDSCNNKQRDSITISAFTSTVNIGPDRVSCANDTIHLNAPGGFLNYQWSNNYNINSTTAQNVIVSPATDTVYYLRAEKIPGCFAYDTVRIKVNTASPILLGADKSFCLGDSAILDAGAGFTRYLWNNSSTLQRITVFAVGSYSVMATTPQGCNSYDTVRVINVWQNPAIILDKKPGLCINSTSILDPGNYASYLWQDGSVLRTFTATSPGTYYVTVKDSYQCTGSDTARILYMLPQPAGFLPSDTTLCSYGEIELKATQNFKRYLWSNGSSTPSLLVKQPGIYRLTVTDYNNCQGADTIAINPEQCMEGVYIPSAFTPNNDGLNDLFKPMVFGNLQEFEMTVFNRYGQTVFTSNNSQNGWNGRYKGLEQDTQTYVWVCRYRLNNKPLQTEKGTVLLLR